MRRALTAAIYQGASRDAFAQSEPNGHYTVGAYREVLLVSRWQNGGRGGEHCAISGTDRCSTAGVCIGGRGGREIDVDLIGVPPVENMDV